MSKILLLILSLGLIVPGLQLAAEDGDADTGALMAELRQFLQVSSARLPGMPGNLELEQKVAERFAASGFEHGEILFNTPSFVPGRTRLVYKDGREILLLPLHPSIFRPGNLKEKKLSARIVYLGTGQAADLDRLKGISLKGTIGLIDFDCGDAWQRFLRFGVKAFIFIGTERYWYRDTILKVYNTEVSVPRFFASATNLGWLRNLLKKGSRQFLQVQIDSEPTRWQKKTVRDLWVEVPGANPDLEKEVFVITAPLDANCIVPELAQGAQAGANLFLLLRLLDEFKKEPPARTVILAAVNAHTHNYLGERMLAWYLLADNEKVEAVRNLYGEQIRQQKMFHSYYSKLKLTPESLEEDTRFFENLRTLYDNSTGKRVNVKEPIQDLARRMSNQTKTTRMDITTVDISEEEKQIRLDELEALDNQYSLVLQLFNKRVPRREVVSLKTLVEYDQSAAGRIFPKEKQTVPILRSYVQQLTNKYRRFSELNLKELHTDEKNGKIRESLAGKSVKVVFELGLVWAGEGIGFSSYSPDIRSPWQRDFGLGLARVARKMVSGEEGESDSQSSEGEESKDKSADKDGLFVDTLTNYGGLPEAHYFPSPQSSTPVFHAAGKTPAFCLRNVYVDKVNEFTPVDTLDHLDPANLRSFIDYVPRLIQAILSDNDLTASDVLKPPPIRHSTWSTELRTFKMDEFSPKPIPELEVPNCVAIIYPGVRGQVLPVIDGGVINSYIQMTDERGVAYVYGIRENVSGRYAMPTAAFHFDRDFMNIDHAIDMGMIQEQQVKSTLIQVVASKILPMFRCQEFPLFDRVDPSLVSASAIMLSEISLLNGYQNTVPRKFGAAGIKVSNSKAGSPKTSGPVSVFGEVKEFESSMERLKILTANGLLALNSTDEDYEGVGFKNSDELGDDFFAKAVLDMSHLNKSRLKKMSGVADQLIEEFIDQGDKAIEDMQTAAENNDHLPFLKSLYRAIGAESKAYIQLRSLNKDMLQAIIFYMALMLPFCFFVQKLIFNFVRIEAQIAAFGILFVITYFVFRMIHPAFKIALTPEAIFVAFVLGTIGGFVTLVMHSRFEGEMTLLFRSYAGSSGEIGHSTAGQQAMVIGVNNMKRRRIRTTLTTATIVLVTFTMLAFSSVSKKMAPTVIPKSDDAPYTGLFYQWPGNLRMDEDSRKVFEDMFAAEGQSIVRRWLLAEPGVAKPSYPMMLSTRSGKSARILAGLGLTVKENGFLAPIPLLPGGRFFSADDALEAILPSGVSEALDIDPKQVGKVMVDFRGLRLKVVGLLDDERFRYIKDLNGKALLPILPDEKQEGQGGGGEEMEVGQEDDSGVAYVDMAQLILLPSDLAKYMGGEPFSISVKFEKDISMWSIMNRVLRITNAKFYLGSLESFAVGDEGKIKNSAGVYYIGSNYTTSIGGLSRLIVPLIIAGTIILNTMLGSVYERRREIAIYNAVGLNPTHIAIFFLAEAFVYGVIGSVSGYLIGQLLAIGLREFDLVGDVNVNFSSLIVIYVIFFTIGLVLLSTLYPAHVATQTAVPSGKRKWSLPEHDGQTMEVAFPFIYHPNLTSGVMVYLVEYFNRFTEASMGEQIAGLESKSTGEDKEGRPTYHLKYDLALVPYDLGVTQKVEFHAAFDSKVESYRIIMSIHRVSGQDSNWVTTNKPFLERMRRLLMQWRNLDATRHGIYVQQAEEFFQTGVEEEGVMEAT